MQKKFFSIIILLLLLYNGTPNNLYAEEISINELYKQYCLIAKTSIEINPIIKEKSDVAIDYAVEIIKRAPESVEAYLTLVALVKIKTTDKVCHKFESMKDKYFSILDDPNNDVAEKLVFIRMMFMVFYDFSSVDEVNKNDIKCFDALIRFKDECKDKGLAALATQLLFYKKNKEDEYRKEFLEKFSENLAIPYVEMDLIANLWANNENQKCIDEALKWCQKYNNLKTPDGYRAVLCAYELISGCYVELKDPENALKYYNMIKSEAPDYSNLYDLKKEIDEMGKQK